MAPSLLAFWATCALARQLSHQCERLATRGLARGEPVHESLFALGGGWRDISKQTPNESGQGGSPWKY